MRQSKIPRRVQLPLRGANPKPDCRPWRGFESRRRVASGDECWHKQDPCLSRSWAQEQICGRRRRRDGQGENVHPFLERWFWSTWGRARSALTEIMRFQLLGFFQEHCTPPGQGLRSLPMPCLSFPTGALGSGFSHAMAPMEMSGHPPRSSRRGKKKGKSLWKWYNPAIQPHHLLPPALGRSNPGLCAELEHLHPVVQPCSVLTRPPTRCDFMEALGSPIQPWDLAPTPRPASRLPGPF